jgi:hypothetical protein
MGKTSIRRLISAAVVVLAVGNGTPPAEQGTANDPANPTIAAARLNRAINLARGLVVKNEIMLLDFSEKLHAQGEPFETAIARAGSIRPRPILITTFCTLVGCCRSHWGLAPAPSCKSRPR